MKPIHLDEPDPGLVCVFVKIAPPASRSADRFFVLPWRELGRIVIAGHSKYLAKHGGVRPRSPKSLHTAVYLRALAKWENQWQVLTQRVRSTSANQKEQAMKRTRSKTAQPKPSPAIHD